MCLKKCNKCNESKDFCLFNKDSSKKDGLATICKECCSKNKKQYYLQNKDKVKNRQKIVYEKKKQYYLDCAKERRYKNKQKNIEYAKIWRNENQEKIKKYNRESYNNNKELNKNRVKSWKKRNSEHCKQYSKTYINNRLNSDPVFKLKHNTRTLIRNSFKKISTKKSEKTEKILGCDIDFFINHISNLFLEGMTIENHGAWHLDHIIPLATAKTEDDVIKLNHYTNFQPLWSQDNLSKGCKFI